MRIAKTLRPLRTLRIPGVSLVRISGTSKRLVHSFPSFTSTYSLRISPNSKIIPINNQFNLFPKSTTQFNYYSSNADTPSTERADLVALINDCKTEMMSIYMNQEMANKTKALRLKDKLKQLILILPDNEFQKEDLQFVNKVVNFIDQSETPTDVFTVSEMAVILRSVLSAMTLEDVHYIDFFPRFYTCLRQSEEYSRDKELRLQLFEIFLNYIMLSKKRANIVRIIDAFIVEEKTLNSNDVSKEVVDIVLEAFKVVKADTQTVLKLAEISRLDNKEIVNSILSNFFIAGDEEIGLDIEENKVGETLIELLPIFERKLDYPMDEYINLLYFATKNYFKAPSTQTLTKIYNLAKQETDNFKDSTLLDSIRDEELLAIVSATVKYQDNNNMDLAKRLIDNLKEKHEFSEFSKSDWISYLEWNMYHIKNSDDGTYAIKLVKDVNEKLEELKNDYQLKDTDTYNISIEALCCSGKSTKAIENFTVLFDEEYGLARDAKSFSTLIEYQLGRNDYREAIDLFNRSLEEVVTWDIEYGGIYMTTLFRLLTAYCDEPEVNIKLKAKLYKDIKVFEYIIDKKALSALVKELLRDHYVLDAIEIFDREAPAIKEGEKYDLESYKDIYNLYLKYSISTFKDPDENYHLMDFLEEKFNIPYDDYLLLLRFWIDSERPARALRIFAKMKKLSKESKLPPPGENVYIYLFKSFAKFKYQKGIFNLHLAMKMDLAINMDMKLLNSAMEAYAALEDPFKVRDIFNLAYSLPKSRGLNDESAYWMLKSLKFATLFHFKDLYNNLPQGYGIKITPPMFRENIIMYCMYEQYFTAFNILRQTLEEGEGYLIDRHVLKDFHNFCLNTDIREKIDQFATENYNVIWTELKESGELLLDNTEQPEIYESAYSDDASKVLLLK